MDNRQIIVLHNQEGEIRYSFIQILCFNTDLDVHAWFRVGKSTCFPPFTLPLALPTPNTESEHKIPQQPPPSREGDKTERIWSSEEFMELRLTLVALWALQGGLLWHTLHTDNTHGARSEQSWTWIFGLFGLLEKKKGRDRGKGYGEQIVFLGRGGFWCSMESELLNDQ